ncbi:MAG: AbrB family transcriptional regulator [Sneathiella sp.]
MINSSLTRFALALVIGCAGGILFSAIHFPLPWLLGALCATLLASLLGAPIEVSKSIRNYIIIVIGIMLGGTFTPEVIDQVPNWIPTLTAAVVYVAVITTIGQIYCRKIAGMDAVTALFSGLPGGLSEMSIMGEEAGADIKKLTLTHACRVVSVLLFIPFVLTYWFDLEKISLTNDIQYWSIQETLTLVAIAVVGMILAKLCRIPAHRLTGPLILSAAVHLSGAITSEPPELASIIIQLILGSALGSRFFGISFKEVGRVIFLAMGMTVLMLSVTFSSAYLLSLLTGYSFEALILALSPGGFAEMALAALSLGVDPAFVTTHHAMRLFAIVFVTPIIIKVILRKGAS